MHIYIYIYIHTNLCVHTHSGSRLHFSYSVSQCPVNNFACPFIFVYIIIFRNHITYIVWVIHHLIYFMFYVFSLFLAVLLLIKYDAVNILIDKYLKISMRILYSEEEKRVFWKSLCLMIRDRREFLI